MGVAVVEGRATRPHSRALLACRGGVSYTGHARLDSTDSSGGELLITAKY